MHKRLAVVFDKYDTDVVEVALLLLVHEETFDTPKDVVTVLFLDGVLFVVALDITWLPVDVPDMVESVGLVEEGDVELEEPVIVAVVGFG